MNGVYPTWTMPLPSPACRVLGHIVEPVSAASQYNKLQHFRSTPRAGPRRHPHASYGDVYNLRILLARVVPCMLSLCLYGREDWTWRY